MAEFVKLKDYYGIPLAKMLAGKILAVYPAFNSDEFVRTITAEYEPLELKSRVRLIATALKQYLPQDYEQAVSILVQIMGEPNPSENGMFTHYYWLMPVGQFIENNGLEHVHLSMNAIDELTQRNTGEYTVRPFLRQNPDEVMKYFVRWASDDSFHVRRLASEGLRPKLPWSAKLDYYITNYQPVFDILEMLKEDPIKFVQRSVANNIADYLKVNPEAAHELIATWSNSSHPATKWILKHATRKVNKD